MASYLRKRREKDIDLSSYRDSKFQGNREEYEAKLSHSTTLYVGNLSFYTSEEQLYELFGKCGDVKRVIVGLNRETRTPCGFCFVEYHTREDARNAMRYVNGTRLDDRPVRTDWDIGFEKGRQYGRGKSGSQVRDEFRQDFDPGRGGYGGAMKDKIEKLKGPADGTAAAAGDAGDNNAMTE